MNESKKKVLMITGGVLDYGGITTWLFNYVSILYCRFDFEILCFGYGHGVR
jgi:hypothetical protein